jgi:hypothetical protein
VGSGRNPRSQIRHSSLPPRHRPVVAAHDFLSFHPSDPSPPMDRGREIPRAGSKRSFDEYDSDAGRRLESQLRGRLEYAEARRQRSREADREYDRRRSPEWRRGEERRRKDERRSEAGPSFVTEQFSKKKVGVRKFSARSRAAAGAPTPTPPPHAPPARPPPSTGLSSQSDPPEPAQGQKKARIKCYNCSRDGHY